jgi:1-acyl-sn-glycerol-3-phosphate acyltransferase
MYWILKTLFGWIIRLIWVKRVEGLENVPKNGAFIIVANHCSYFDFISLIAVCPRRIYFLAGEVFFKKFWWGLLVRSTGQIRVNRDSKDKADAKQKALSILKNGEVLGIFPEGTRSPDGKIGKTFTGVAKFALETEVPVLPVGITGSFEVMSRHDKRPKFRKKIVVNFGKPIYFEEYFGKENDEIILRQLTDKVVNEIESLKYE